MNLEEDEPKTPRERVRRKQIYTLMIVAFLGAVAAGLLLASSVWQWKWDTPGSPPPQAAPTGVDPTKSCTLQSTLDAIKTELFRRAAQSRGRDEAAYTRIAGFSLFRIDGASPLRMDDQQHRVDCSGNADLELPPEITVATAGSTLSGPIDYSVQLDVNGNATGVTVGNADSIVVPLATIASLAPPAPLTAPAPVNEATPGFTAQTLPSAPAPEQSPTQLQNETGTVPPSPQPAGPQNEQ